jgi:myo-inositol 2-dehydrogenase/D-chiro-inositol 1-dehydrogenase
MRGWRRQWRIGAFDTEFREWLAAAAKGGAAGPSARDGYVATVISGIGVGPIESGQRGPIKLRQRPALYAAA